MNAIITDHVFRKLIVLLNDDIPRIRGAVEQLQNDLENNQAALTYFRGCRNEKEQYDYFDYSCHWITNGTWNHLYFLVSDKQALDGILLVDEVSK
jgi:hypothetical protein